MEEIKKLLLSRNIEDFWLGIEILYRVAPEYFDYNHYYNIIPQKLCKFLYEEVKVPYMEGRELYNIREYCCKRNYFINYGEEYKRTL